MTTRRHFMNVSTRAALAVVLAGSAVGALAQKPPVTLLNVSYDPTRELYAFEVVETTRRERGRGAEMKAVSAPLHAPWVL